MTPKQELAAERKARAETAEALRADADATWGDAVVGHYGTVEGVWRGGTCVIGGDRYEPIEGEGQ